MSDDRFKMLYCDQISCRVNSFEAGDGSDMLSKRPGLCPACGRKGNDFDTHETWEPSDE
jgi:hypothetical protein